MVITIIVWIFEYSKWFFIQLLTNIRYKINLYHLLIIQILLTFNHLLVLVFGTIQY